MQERVEHKWGCPFMRGKLIGIFRYALGVNCWADERAYFEDGEPVVEFSLYQSTMTIGTEVKRLRAEQATARARRLQEEVDLRTMAPRNSEARLRATLASMNSWVFTLDREARIQSHHVPDGPGAANFPTEAVGRELGDIPRRPRRRSSRPRGWCSSMARP